MITLTNLSYRYPSGALALKEITTQINPGIHLLLGENGSGKTTLLHLIAGLRLASPQSACTIDGMATAARKPSLLDQVFILTDNMMFPFGTINQMVKYHAPFYPSFDAEMLARNLEAFGMTGFEKIDRFSLGNRKKAQLAYILALRPRVLLLDEPANGLDITARGEFTNMLARCTGEDQIVIVSTHTVFDVRNLIEYVMVLSHGRLILSMPVWDITERVAFVSEQLPPENAIFMQQSFGRFNSIVPNDGSQQTDIDYTLLYAALQSPAAAYLIKQLNPA